MTATLFLFDFAASAPLAVVPFQTHKIKRKENSSQSSTTLSQVPLLGIQTIWGLSPSFCMPTEVGQARAASALSFALIFLALV